MSSKFQPAYVAVAVEDVSNTRRTAAFIANLSGTLSGHRAACTPTHDCTTSAHYWMVQILSAHQEREDCDADPDEIYHLHKGSIEATTETGLTYGLSPPVNVEDNTVCICLETMRDMLAQENWWATMPALGLPPPHPDREPVTVVHEVGHVFGCLHLPGADSIMQPVNAEDPTLLFWGGSLAKIRRSTSIEVP